MKAKLCKRGHARTPENVYLNGSCKVCDKMRREGLLCKRGHERIPENLYANGGCKLCDKMRPKTAKHFEAQKTANKKHIEEITDRYVAHCLGMPIEEALKDKRLMKLKRENIALKRENDALRNRPGEILFTSKNE